MRKYYINNKSIGIQSIPEGTGYDFISIIFNKNTNREFNYTIPASQVFSTREVQTLAKFLVSFEKTEFENLFEPINRQNRLCVHRRTIRNEKINHKEGERGNARVKWRSFKALEEHNLEGRLPFNFANNIIIAKRMTKVSDLYNSFSNWISTFTNIKDGDYDDGDGFFEEDLNVCNSLHNWISNKWKGYFEGRKNWKHASKEIDFGKVYPLSLGLTGSFDADTLMPIKGTQGYFVKVSWDEMGRLYFDTFSTFSEEGESETDFSKRYWEWIEERVEKRNEGRKTRHFKQQKLSKISLKYQIELQRKKRVKNDMDAIDTSNWEYTHLVIPACRYCTGENELPEGVFTTSDMFTCPNCGKKYGTSAYSSLKYVPFKNGGDKTVKDETTKYLVVNSFYVKERDGVLTELPSLNCFVWDFEYQEELEKLGNLIKITKDLDLINGPIRFIRSSSNHHDLIDMTTNRKIYKGSMLLDENFVKNIINSVMKVQKELYG